MARGVNKAIIIGNLGNDPELKNDGNICNISVATSETWKDKNTGEQKERTEWHRVTAFGRLAEIMAEYLKKGSKVYIEGSIRTDKYQDKDTGQDRYSTSIVASQMQMLDSRGVSPDSDGGFSSADSAQPAPASAAALDDDIPF